MSERNVSVRLMEEKTGIPFTNVSKIANGKRGMKNIDKLRAIARAVAVPLDWLTDGTGPDPFADHGAPERTVELEPRYEQCEKAIRVALAEGVISEETGAWGRSVAAHAQTDFAFSTWLRMLEEHEAELRGKSVSRLLPDEDDTPPAGKPKRVK